MFTENHEIFPILITVIRDFITVEQCNTIFKRYNNDPTQKKHSLLIGDTTSNFHGYKSVHREICNLTGCFEFHERLQDVIQFYSKTIGVRWPVFISNSWINIQNENSLLKRHTHPDSQISGAVYINVDENSSNFYIFNPNPYLHFTQVDQASRYCQTEYRISPRKGDLVLFPSWLAHGSNEEINQTKDRMVFSFNTMFDNKNRERIDNE